MTTSTLGRAALEVYLDHTSLNTSQLSARLREHEDGTWHMKTCSEACDTLLRYLRSARSICSVGIAAVDRCEEHLRQCLASAREMPRSTYLKRSMNSVAGLCYANALNRRSAGDVQVSELWLHAGECSDRIAKLQPSECVVEDRCRERFAPHATRQHLLRKAVEFDEQQLAAQKAAETWRSRFLARAAPLCRYAIVCGQICEIYQAWIRYSPSIAEEMIQRMAHHGNAAQSAVSIIEDNATVYKTADETHSAEIQALAVIAAQRLEEAVVLTTAPPATVLTTASDYASEQEARTRTSALLARNAKALAKLASGLSAVSVQLASVGAAVADRSATASEGSAQALDDIADRIQQLIATITVSASGHVGLAMHVNSQTVLEETIRQLSTQLSAVQSAAPSREERAIIRFLAEADKVCRETSPAHPHIAECWLQAAEDLRQVAELNSKEIVSTYRVEKMRESARVRSQLAAGTFTVAGTYYAKSKRSTNLLAKELWNEAAVMLVEAGVIQQGGREGATASCMAGAGAYRCAKACVACAEAVDSSAAPHAIGTNFALLTISTVENTEDGTYADIALKMRLLLVHVERAALIQVPALQSTGIFKDDHVIANLRSMVTDVLHLSLGSQFPATSYPVGHVLHQPPLSAETAKHNFEQLQWQCDHAVRCVDHIRHITTHQERLSDSNKSLPVAVTTLQTAVRLADGIRYFTYSNDRRKYPDAEFVVRSKEQVSRYRVLCHRYLTASQLIWAGQPVAHKLLVRAAKQCWEQEASTPMAIAVSDTLIRRAFQQATELKLSPELLLPSTVDTTNQATARWLHRIAEVHIKQINLEQTIEANSNYEGLGKKAIAHYGRAIEALQTLLAGGPESFPAQIQRWEAVCDRAERAGLWSTRILQGGVEAVDAAMLYALAIEYAATAVTSNARKVTADDQAQLLGDKVGMRFAAAAEALAVGNSALHECWLQAAISTAALVTLTPILVKGKGSDKVKVVFSAAYSADAVSAADALEAQALALQAVQQQQGK
jgi:PHD/YefM family antitoxin component YafN of YafNO toxin-antitoxin module